MRTAKGKSGNVQPHMENNLDNVDIMASLTRSIHLMMLGRPGFEAVKMVFIIWSGTQERVYLSIAYGNICLVYVTGLAKYVTAH